jgi:hypothetical protein
MSARVVVAVPVDNRCKGISNALIHVALWIVYINSILVAVLTLTRRLGFDVNLYVVYIC